MTAFFLHMSHNFLLIFCLLKYNLATLEIKFSHLLRVCCCGGGGSGGSGGFLVFCCCCFLFWLIL